MHSFISIHSFISQLVIPELQHCNIFSITVSLLTFFCCVELAHVFQSVICSLSAATCSDGTGSEACYDLCNVVLLRPIGLVTNSIVEVFAFV